MPKYEFECESCNVGFERNLKMGDHLTHPCPSCGEESHRVWDENSLASFSFKGGQSGSTANTGVHAEDYPTADRAVGRDAEARWGEIHEREKVKQEARKMGDTHALIRHNSRDFIDYEPMTQTGRQARRKLADSVFETMRSERSEKRAGGGR